MNKREFLKTMAKASAFGAANLASSSLFGESMMGNPLSLMLGSAAHGMPQRSHYFVYVGLYTAPRSSAKGIYGYRYDTKTAQWDPLEGMPEVENPSWVTTDPQHRFLYAVTESKVGSISSYAINPTSGALTFLNKVDAHGGGSCHLTVDRSTKVLLVANYNTGSIASFAIKANGSIGEMLDFVQDSGSSIDSRRQKGPHAHEMVLSPDNRFLFVPELGLDQIKTYRFNAGDGKFTPNHSGFVGVTPGYGPRHLTFGATGKFAYLVCEMKSSVMAFSYDQESGTLTHIQTISDLPPDFSGENNSGEIQVDRSGRFLYASNRGHDSITVFEIDKLKGTLTKIQLEPSGGKIPRNFVFDPTGKTMIVANQDSNQINIFKVDPNTGKLEATDQKLSVPAPVCVLFVPAG